MNEEFEYEWRLHEIPQRHSLLYVCLTYIIYVDIVFGVILAATTWESKVFRAISTLICIISIYQIIYNSEVKRIKQIRLKHQLGLSVN